MNAATVPAAEHDQHPPTPTPLDKVELELAAVDRALAGVDADMGVLKADLLKRDFNIDSRAIFANAQMEYLRNKEAVLSKKTHLVSHPASLSHCNLSWQRSAMRQRSAMPQRPMRK
jgi:hypothetical protein